MSSQTVNLITVLEREFMSTITSSARRAALAGALAGAAAAGVAVTGVAPAHADAFVRLPNGTQTGDAGLTLIRTGESARISPSLAANGLGRTAWVTGNVVVKAPNLTASAAGPNNGPAGETGIAGTNGTSNDGAAATISVGYIVGCQVQIGNLTAGISGSINQAGTPTGTGSISLPISPGQVLFAQLDYKNVKKKGTYYFGWKNTQLQIQNCAGYAQARSFVTVETSGEDHQKINLYGKPFSIG